MNKLLSKYYKRSKQYVIPLVLVISSVVILTQVTLKQIDEIGSLQDDINKTRNNIENSRQTLNILNTTPQDQLEAYFALATAALPLEKNIARIFSGLENAAEKSNVNLSGVSFNIGGIFDLKEEEKKISGIPTIPIKVEASGEMDMLEQFISELSKTSPLVEVKEVSIRSGVGTYEVDMFYKPLSFEKLASNMIIRPLSSSQMEILKKLREWNN